jgi:plasmid stabilization system protein ParE
MAVFWKPLAIEDRDRIFDCTAQDKPHAALKPDTECQSRPSSSPSAERRSMTVCSSMA